MKLAFKNAARAVELETNPLAKLFSEGIALVTGGAYSHVELWLDGSITSARCFAAREPAGSGFATLDLSDAALWATVCVPDKDGEGWSCATSDFAWCQGRGDRRYNFKGIDAIAFGAQFTDIYDDFCSQLAFEFLQDRRNMFLGWHQTEWIAPSGFGVDGKRFGLYELMTGAQTLP